MAPTIHERLMAAVEREETRAVQYGLMQAEGCDLAASYHPDVRAIRSLLHEICAEARKEASASYATAKMGPTTRHPKRGGDRD